MKVLNSTLLILSFIVLLHAVIAFKTPETEDWLDVDYLEDELDLDLESRSLRRGGRWGRGSGNGGRGGRGKGGWGGHWGRGCDKNYTNVTCAADEEEIVCGRSWYDINRTGTLVCRTKESRHWGSYNYTTCTDNSRALVNDTCGCCGGLCNISVCQCGCNVTRRDTVITTDGVLVQRVHNSIVGQYCVTQEYAATLQVISRPYECVSICPA